MEDKKNQKKEYIIIAIIIFILVLLDQIIKVVVLQHGEISILPGILKFNVVENTGRTLGIGEDSTFTYIIKNLIVIGIVFKFMTSQNQMIDKKTKILLSLILAGGISNIIDKIFRGCIIEYIDFRDWINFPAFNLADIYIIIGWVSLAAIFAVFTVKEYRNKK